MQDSREERLVDIQQEEEVATPRPVLVQTIDATIDISTRTEDEPQNQNIDNNNNGEDLTQSLLGDWSNVCSSNKFNIGVALPVLRDESDLPVEAELSTSENQVPHSCACGIGQWCDEHHPNWKLHLLQVTNCAFVSSPVFLIFPRLVSEHDLRLYNVFNFSRWIRVQSRFVLNDAHCDADVVSSCFFQT
jgi:hypothetical protein